MGFRKMKVYLQVPVTVRKHKLLDKAEKILYSVISVAVFLMEWKEKTECVNNTHGRDMFN